MKTVISAVIRFLQQSSGNSVSAVDNLIYKLDQDLPEEARESLRQGLAQQPPLSWTAPVEELSTLQQTIASFFPLIRYQEDAGSDAKTAYTALEVFSMGSSRDRLYLNI